MRQHAAKANNKPQNNGNSATPAKSGPQIARTPESSGARMKRNEWRITKMVLAIFLSFVVCYLPITIAKVADPEVKYPGLHIMGYILLYLSACINPIIYVIMNKQYRQAYKTVLLCERPRILNFTAGGNSSAQEKSKERLACSYNHSRTFLSIVSIADPPTGVSTVQPDQNVY
ncbi:G-protein coupled receptor moody-like [Ctenocephalides felis]|uniref:G-protein coupled receptor moody-like n=1 Tax=Ctenocephalides felis TaxID=7515 RepID=UPI000E6E11AC|nr:G-protein coupled receptor moody-like [Ctenocephalides felis]